MERKIERIKSLGQMDALELFESTMDPNQQCLYNINIADWSKSKQIASSELMGIKSDKWKEFLELSYHELALTIDKKQKVKLFGLSDHFGPVFSDYNIMYII